MKKSAFLLIFSSLLFAACTHTTTPSTDLSSKVPAPNSTGVEETTVSDELPNTGQNQPGSTREFAITAKQWEWLPSVITVNQGDLVKLTITSADVNHGLNIPDYNINKLIPAGETITVEFTADKTGEFRFSCSVACGQGHGQMTGTLIVQ